MLPPRGAVSVANDMIKLSQFLVFLAAAITALYIQFWGFSSAVWPNWPGIISHLSLACTVSLGLSALLSLLSPLYARLLDTFSLIGMGIVFLPSSHLLVPLYQTAFNWFMLSVLCGYLATLSFALLYPQRWRLSLPILSGAIAVSVLFFGCEYIERLKSGHYERPSISFFSWHPKGAQDPYNDSNMEWLRNDVRDLLTQYGVEGHFKFSSSIGHPSNPKHLVVICKGLIPEDKHLFFARNEVAVIYIFDGESWFTIPRSFDTYSEFAILEKSGRGKQDGTIWLDGSGFGVTFGTSW